MRVRRWFACCCRSFCGGTPCNDLHGRLSAGRRLLELRPLVSLGLFSYSIYLIHSPILALANILLLPLQLPTLTNRLLLVFVAVPAAVAISYGFFWIVERHFVTGHQKRVFAEKTHQGETPSVPDVAQRRDA
ncbi:acyltransferase family protein [Herbiconiux sp. A18JL235]|uniref:Acyltransferase family protein n=1 Tax=Herbiconiux sp. A18JL235 TaxID=3152363 RepID=A0AB39BLT4_9MICO